MMHRNVLISLRENSFSPKSNVTILNRKPLDYNTCTTQMSIYYVSVT